MPTSASSPTTSGPSSSSLSSSSSPSSSPAASSSSLTTTPTTIISINVPLLANSHGLQVGDEIDYNVIDGYWVPARVEQVLNGGSELYIRFTCGNNDVRHRIDFSRAGDAKRISAACMRSVPLVDKQPVDVLRRTGATSTLGPSEQWQRGEVVTSISGLTSYGGSKPVAVRVLSSGESLLGVTYGVAGNGNNNSNSSSQTSSSRGGGGAASTLTSSTTTTSSSGSSNTTSGSPLVLAEPSSLAPAGLYGKWVPTTADVSPVVTSSTPPPGIRDLHKRARAVYNRAGSVAETTARFTMEGRRMLRDYDLIDILPRIPTAKQRRQYQPIVYAAPSGGGGTIVGGGVVGGDQTALNSSSSNTSIGGAGSGVYLLGASSPLIEAMRRVYGAENPLGHVGEPILEPALSSLLMRTLPKGSDDVVLQSSKSTASSSTSTSTSSSDGSSETAPSQQQTSSSSSSSPTIPEESWRGKIGFSQMPWYLARIRIHSLAADGSAIGINKDGNDDEEEEEEEGGGRENMTTPAKNPRGTDDDSSSSSPPSSKSSKKKEKKTSAQNGTPNKDGAATTTTTTSTTSTTTTNGIGGGGGLAYAYWFEPTVSDDLLSVHSILRVVPINEVLVVAPAGTYTCPYVPGQRLDSRRMGGKWSPNEVVHASRNAVVLRAPRPQKKEDDVSAITPRKIAVFHKKASPMKIFVDALLSRGGRKKKNQQQQSAKDTKEEDTRKTGSNKTGAVAAAVAAVAAAAAAKGEVYDTTSAGNDDARAVATAESSLSENGKKKNENVSSSASNTTAIEGGGGSSNNNSTITTTTTATTAPLLLFSNEDSTEMIAQHLWQYTLARSGFYCAEGFATTTTSNSGSNSSSGSSGRGIRGMSIVEFFSGGGGGGSSSSSKSSTGSSNGSSSGGSGMGGGTVAIAAANVMDNERVRKRAGSVFG